MMYNFQVTTGLQTKKQIHFDQHGKGQKKKIEKSQKKKKKA